MAGSHGDCLSLNHGGLGDDQNRVPANNRDSLDLQESGEQRLLDGQTYGGGEGGQNVPNIVLTGGCGSAPIRFDRQCSSLFKTPAVPRAGESPPGLSKEIANALSHIPGFEMDPFSLDDPLRMDPLSLDMLEGDLMLADPAVEDSFRSDRFK